MDCNFKTFSGKTALITGCNRGIGKATMNLFSENGASIIACCRKESIEFKQEIQQLSKKNNVSIIPLYFDMRNEDEIKLAMKSIYSNRFHVDILVNNAGHISSNLLQMTSMTQLREMFEVNFFSHVLITQYIVKLMIKQNSGNVVNVASIVGMDGFPGYTAYGSSKASLIYFTKTIAKELAQYNIRVNAISPGIVNTDMVIDMGEKAQMEMKTKSVLKRMGTPEEIAQSILFLASNQSSYITGQIIRIDGGI